MSALAQVEIINIAVLALVIGRVLGIRRMIEALSREVTPPQTVSGGLTPPLSVSRGMTPPPGVSGGAPPPLRASHADRDLAVDILRVAAGDGRLTTAELEERLETALTARTISELATITADLPTGSMLTGAMLPPARVAVMHTADRSASRWALLQSLAHQF